MKDDKIIKYLPTIQNYNPDLIGTNEAVIVDVEATGPDIEKDSIIKLTMLPFTFTDDFKVCEVKSSIDMLNDPGVPITEEITKFTGITNEMVSGKKLDSNLIKETLKGKYIIAHNVYFDRNILEKHVDIDDEKWLCSLYDVDYRKRFISSKALDYIAFRLGFWFDSHDSTEDCRALLHILAITDFLEEMFSKLYTETYTVILRETKFEENHILKEMKFKWSPEEKYWSKKGVLEEEFPEIKEGLKKLSTYNASKKVDDPTKRYKLIKRT